MGQSQKKYAALKLVNGVPADVNSSVPPGAEVEDVFPEDPRALDTLRHSCAHLLAQAVTELFPSARYGVGPALETGFYYDFLVEKPFTPEDLEAISRRMKALAKAGVPVERLDWSRDEALAYFAEKGQYLKVELIEEKVDGERVSLYRQGGFVDLCRGPHVPDTSLLRHFALTSVAAAYWKGDQRNASMQRIYGVVFPSQEALDAHLTFLKEVQARDHRRLGKDLDLFSLHEEAGPGLVYWHPKGGRIRYEIEKFWKEEHYQNGYEMVVTPHLGKSWLWETSGHLDFYRDSMFPAMEMDGHDYYAKPMNCPFHIMIYKSGKHSYRELPFRWAEMGTVYRYEKSGVLHGLLRVRGFTQDDAHIICTPEQVGDEIHEALRFSLHMLRSFGFEDFKAYLATRPAEKSVGQAEDWDVATQALHRAIERENLPYQVDEGGGAFYGPKIDLKIKDAVGREWQLSTVQFDFNLPERFDMVFMDSDGREKRPFMVHRALLGSIERFFGVLVEHYGGAFPVWLAPVQAIVLPISDRHEPYARQVGETLRHAGIRVEVNDRREGIGRKIRDAEKAKVPYILVVGDEEEQQKSLALRIHKLGDRGRMGIDAFIAGVKAVIEGKKTKYEF